MGTFRVLLATAVVFQHIGSLFGLTMTGTVVSVEAFYIVSGFYMALILSEKYVGEGSYRLFISNRFLKIFPGYWVVLLLTLTASAISWSLGRGAWFAYAFAAHADTLSPGALAYLILTNLLLFGQDTVMFLGARSGDLVFASNFRDTSPQLFTFLLVPQAWTLALELTFYLIAPLLAGWRSRWLVLVCAASLLLRVYIYKVVGWNDDPWTYRFFPHELLFFVSGMLSYRLYQANRERISPAVGRYVWALVMIATVVYQFLPGGTVRMAGYFAAVVIALPFVFAATRNVRFDRKFGEMSYHIYLTHLLVLGVVLALLPESASEIGVRLTVIGGTFLLSWLILRFVIQPIEEFRQGRVRSAALRLAR